MNKRTALIAGLAIVYAGATVYVGFKTLPEDRDFPLHVCAFLHARALQHPDYAADCLPAKPTDNAYFDAMVGRYHDEAEGLGQTLLVERMRK